jgi:DNA invertase Pin-like site-specific DNA recombinase
MATGLQPHDRAAMHAYASRQPLLRPPARHPQTADTRADVGGDRGPRMKDFATAGYAGFMADEEIGDKFARLRITDPRNTPWRPQTTSSEGATYAATPCGSWSGSWQGRRRRNTLQVEVARTAWATAPGTTDDAAHRHLRTAFHGSTEPDVERRSGRGLPSRSGLSRRRDRRDYLDPELSGYRRDRPGLRALLRDVRDGLVDVVVCEALDRIARDAEDVAWLGKKLKFSRVRLHTVSENEIDDIKLAVASMLGSIFLSQLQQKTLRGMQAAVLAGRFAGGRAYGCRKVNRMDESGNPVRGLLEIDATEADVVRRIYREYANGRSAREIAKRLNTNGVPSPRGGQWNQSTVRGDPAKHVGILNNPLYRGEFV